MYCVFEPLPMLAVTELPEQATFISSSFAFVNQLNEAPKEVGTARDELSRLEQVEEPGVGVVAGGGVSPPNSPRLIIQGSDNNAPPLRLSLILKSQFHAIK